MTALPLIVEKSDGIALFRLNRPEARNALNESLLQALIDAVVDARQDQEIRCVVITGNGPAFSAGGDLKAMPTMTKAGFREYILLLQRLSTEMRRLDKPSIAAINGYCLAGGFELAAISDIRIAADNAIFGLPDTPIGLSPTSGLTYLLQRIVGLGWAKYLTLTGESIDAATAERIGFVTKVAPAANLESAALDLARVLARIPPLALRYTKLGIDLAADGDLQTALTYETDAEVTCFDTDEVRANLAAFANRKKRS